MVEICKNRVRDADLRFQATNEKEASFTDRVRAVEMRENAVLKIKKLIDEERSLRGLL